MIPRRQPIRKDESTQVDELHCVCGATFDLSNELPVPESVHFHCPVCGSYYDSELNWWISKEQVRCIMQDAVLVASRAVPI